MSKYLILEHHQENPDVPGVWVECVPVDAPSAEAAVRTYVARTPDAGGGVFLAIPERSAKTIRVKVETVQKVSVDAGDDG